MLLLKAIINGFAKVTVNEGNSNTLRNILEKLNDLGLGKHMGM